MSQCPPDTTVLFPCPFCGGKPEINEHPFWTISCEDDACLAISIARCADSFKSASEIWNTRATPTAGGGDAQGARAEAFEEAAKIAENNGWEATAAQIRDLAVSRPIPSPIGNVDGDQS